MGALGKLGFEVRSANVLQRAVQKVASTRFGAWYFSKTLHLPDKALFKATGGRLTVPALLAGLPVMMLTTTGAKIGSNYGQRNTPGWVHNLEADPSAVVAYRDRSVEVVARRADEAETDRIFALGHAFYPGYAKYRLRADHRIIRVFILETAT